MQIVGKNSLCLVKFFSDLGKLRQFFWANLHLSKLVFGDFALVQILKGTLDITFYCKRFTTELKIKLSKTQLSVSLKRDHQRYLKTVRTIKPLRNIALNSIFKETNCQVLKSVLHDPK